jgi:hypothetical protein
MQQKLKIDATAGPQFEMPPPVKPIRGERAELSPEMMDSAAGPDQRTAGLSEDVIRSSLSGVGGAQQQAPRSLSDASFEVPGLTVRRDAPKEDTRKAPVDPATQQILADLDAKAGLSKTQEGPRYGTKVAAEMIDSVVPEKDRVQVSVPSQRGLQFAPAPGGGGSGPSLKEVKAGEATAYTTIDPQNQANIKRADQNRYEAAGQLGAAQEKGNVAATGVMAEVPAGLTNLERERQMQEESIAHRVQLDHEKLDNLRDETRKDVDPNAFWKSRPASDKFMGALAMGIGAYVQAMGGGPNQPMAILNSAIKEEIDAQKSNRDAAHQRFQDMRGQMSERKALFADERQNFLAKKSAYLEQAQSKLTAYAQDAKTDEQKAQIADMQARIQRESEMTMAEFGKVSHQVQTKVIQTGGHGGPRMEDLNRGLVVQDLSGNKYLARSDGAAKKIQEVRPLTQTAVEAAKEMRTISNKSGFEKLDPTDPAVESFNFARERFVNSMNSLMGQGVVKDDDIKRYTKEILGGPYGLSTAKIADNFARQASSQFDQHFKANVDTETEVEERAEMDAKGVIKKGVHYNQQQLLTGQAPRGQVNFRPAGK